MKYIEELYIGQEEHVYEIVPVELMQSIMFHIVNLKIMHLVCLEGFDDDHVAEILEGAMVCEYVNNFLEMIRCLRTGGLYLCDLSIVVIFHYYCCIRKPALVLFYHTM